MLVRIAYFCIALVTLTSGVFTQTSNAQSQEGANTDLVRTTSNGEIAGTRAENGAHVWRSVPYAASTAGENRWRSPQPRANWEGVRDATQFGERCPQRTNFFNPVEGLENGVLIGDEDCLSVDIYAPANAMESDAPLPVMVWIHGGSNVSGSSNLYDASRLAAHENVIIIGVQYRLGPLGWFSHELFDGEGEGANFGTQDIIAALQWVKQNAANFGGNPDLVTLFGESAGGHNVVTMLAAPSAKGLFHRAIIQSGSFDSTSVSVAREGAKGFANPSNTIVGRVNAQSAADMRALSVADLFAAYDTGTGFTDLPRIIEDGVTLPNTPMRAVFANPQTFNAVPIITGTNRDEMKLFQLGNPRLTRRIFGTLFQARNQKLYDVASDYTSRVWRIRSVDQPAKLMIEGGHTEVYGYRFDWDDGGSFLVMDLAKILGAAHAMEIPFVFNKFVLLGEADKVLFKKKTEESRQVLSRAMGRYWANFARNGVPSDPTGGVAWPPYAAQDGSLLRLDAVRRKRKDRGIEVITGADTMSALIDDLVSEKRISAEQRCEVAQAVIDWVPSLEQRIRAGVCP